MTFFLVTVTFFSWKRGHTKKAVKTGAVTLFSFFVTFVTSFSYYLIKKEEVLKIEGKRGEVRCVDVYSENRGHRGHRGHTALFFRGWSIQLSCI